MSDSLVSGYALKFVGLMFLCATGAGCASHGACEDYSCEPSAGYYEPAPYYTSWSTIYSYSYFDSDCDDDDDCDDRGSSSHGGYYNKQKDNSSGKHGYSHDGSPKNNRSGGDRQAPRLTIDRGERFRDGSKNPVAGPQQLADARKPGTDTGKKAAATPSKQSRAEAKSVKSGKSGDRNDDRGRDRKPDRSGGGKSDRGNRYR